MRSTLPCPVQPGKTLNGRPFFLIGLILLVALSGSSLWYFHVGAQKTPTHSPAQAVAATATVQTYNAIATAAVQAYATEVVLSDNKKDSSPI
ncbi:MAG TPA: hypothetical protein VL485_07855 [Ktedonobacteraceae bacterium]|jgi:hypothetical protein|nr:hypothetical protein [Ktedonobacteraceae bacterium]